MDNSIRIRIVIDAIKYMQLRDKFINKSGNIISECVEFEEEMIQQYIDDELILHFGDDGSYEFAAAEAQPGYFHIDTIEIGSASPLDLAMRAEMIVVDHLDMLDYMIESAINESLNNLLN